MCEYCEKEKIIFEKEFISEWLVGWDKKQLAIDLFTDSFKAVDSVFIDSRGYIRFVDYTDSGCLDHGEKITIQFCPFCGYKFHKDKEVTK